MEKKQDTPRRLKIWMIYQGDEGARCADLLSLEAEKLDCEVQRTVDHEPILNMSVLTRVRQDCDNCDAAIAIVAPDNRYASDAGNVWVEVGLWLGSRDEKLMKVVQHRDTQFPSDLRGSVVAQYSNDTELLKVFVEQVHYLERRLSSSLPTRQDGKSKVQAIFGSGVGHNWMISESYACQERILKMDACPARAASMEFAAELLRMGTANHERHTIKDSLSRLAILGQEIIILSPPKARLNDHAERRRFINEFLVEGRRIYYAEELFDRRKGESTSFSPTERFKCFLKQKLSCARNISKQKYRAIRYESQHIAGLEREVESACKWLSKFLSDDFAEEIAKRKWTTGFRLDFGHYLQYCQDIAFILQDLSYLYYAECQKVLSGCSSASGNPRTIHQKINATIHKLPHNADRLYPPIWRRA